MQTHMASYYDGPADVPVYTRVPIVLDCPVRLVGYRCESPFKETSSDKRLSHHHPHHPMSKPPPPPPPPPHYTDACSSHPSPPVAGRSSTDCDDYYGELVVLGYNGHLINYEKGRKRSKFVLLKRAAANGVKPYKKHVVKNPQNSKAVQDSALHSVSYTMSRNQAVVVEYKSDPDTDMFQIGRSGESPIDFIVMDTVPANQRRYSGEFTQSTISRFACRILVERNPPYTARIFAAGFDGARNIFLGEKAVKWHSGEEIDGLTTNGVFIMSPTDGFTPASKPGTWYEVSVGGGIYTARNSRADPLKSHQMLNADNVLHDGTLIDLCGVTLLWRSASGLNASPNEQEFNNLVEGINACRPQCPVGLTTLVLPSKSHASPGLDKQPFVYIKCGHVHGRHTWGQKDDEDDKRTCPLCLKESPFIKLEIGFELSFYVDACPPTYCFSPCGHMASENTVKYWSEVLIPHASNEFHAICPFCAVPLDNPGFVKLIFQDQDQEL